MFRYVAVCCGTASGEPVPFNGQFLQAFDPNIRFEDVTEDNSIGHFTYDLDMALRFRNAMHGIKWIMQTPRLVPEFVCSQCWWHSAYETAWFVANGPDLVKLGCPNCNRRTIEFTHLRPDGKMNCPLSAFNWDMVDMLDISEGKWKRLHAPSVN